VVYKGLAAAVFEPARFKNHMPGSKMISRVQKLILQVQTDTPGSKMIPSTIPGAEFATVSVPGDHGGCYGAKRVMESSQKCL
jgi:hypothetical protein